MPSQNGGFAQVRFTHVRKLRVSDALEGLPYRTRPQRHWNGHLERNSIPTEIDPSSGPKEIVIPSEVEGTCFLFRPTDSRLRHTHLVLGLYFIFRIHGEQHVLFEAVFAIDALSA